MKGYILKNWYWLAAIVIAWIVGFFMGRSQSEIIKKVEYVKGETIHDTIPYPELVPYKVVIPSDPKLPTKPDTITLVGEKKIVIETVDTSAIIKDFIKENSYQTKLFDNEKEGKLIVNSTVQYNQLQGLGYSFTPVEKVVTVQNIKTFTPFVTGSYNSFNQVGAGAGIYIKNVGIGAKYIKDLNTNKTGYEGGLFIKF